MSLSPLLRTRTGPPSRPARFIWPSLGSAAATLALASVLILAPAFGLPAGLSALAGLTSASAHEQLLESAPATNEKLNSAPTEIAVSFSDDIMELGAVLRLTDAAGDARKLGEAQTSGATVSASVDEELADGAYTVAWRVVSGDGHPISGLIPFTVGEAEAGTLAADAVQPSAAPPADAGLKSAQTTDATAEPAGMPAPLRTVLLAAGGAALALAIAWVVVMARRRLTTRRPTA